MGEIDDLKADLRKLSARATTWKMNLHDLSEELPVNWETIPEIARQTHEAYAKLAEAKAKLAALGGA
ncbi:MAG: hypothetical protein H7841_04660 [Magnetospirillum sp. WYHS-4]